ncbi:MAG TPA: SDR family NAD(P)-dependent oxidoreductase [Ktedonobacteraceae bacterium]|nr:SDR family NAD(P)-dependent oxidoreductase [Ktedonobacteraceae bacterium]
MIKHYRTAIVTGASQGIGPFIVRALAKEGMNLVLAARSGDELERVATATDVRATGVHVLTVPTDVTDREALSALVNAAERTFGSVDVLINNAGGDLQREFHNYRADDVEALIRLNLTAPIELTRLLLPGMLRRKQGHIVNISSVGGSVGFPYTEVYSAAKDGLIAFTRVLRADYRKNGVSGSVLILGPIRDAGTGARTMEEMNLPMSAMGKAFMSPPEAVAQAVLKSIRRDKAELVIMPGPGRLIRALMTLFPGMGPALNQMTGSTQVMKQVADFRERQREELNTNKVHPVEQR